MSHKEFDDKPSPEKEAAVREALGVDRLFNVCVIIPIYGSIGACFIVKSLNKEKAEQRAIELFNKATHDDDNNEIETEHLEYEHAQTDGWTIKVDDFDKKVAKEDEADS